MKDGTKYASRLKAVFAKLRKSAPKVPPADADDPLRRLAIAILGENGDEDYATRAVDRIFKTVVDWNELRVSTAQEVLAAAGLTGVDATHRAQHLLHALRAIYVRENRVSLNFLSEMPRREVRQYLEKVDGISPYAAASVILWSLGGHALPIDHKLMLALREANLVHPEATIEEIQAFVERNISAADAKEFAQVIRQLITAASAAKEAARAAQPARAKAAKAARTKAAGPAARKEKSSVRKGSSAK